MTMYPTAYLEHHADVFAAHMLHKHGLTLTQYLADPDRYQQLLNRPFPLLPAQTRVRTRFIAEEIQQERAQVIEQELDNLPRNNVRPFEPMRHHRFPKRRGAACGFRSSRHPKPQTV